MDRAAVLQMLEKEKNRQNYVKLLRFCNEGKTYVEIADSKKGVGFRGEELFQVILKLKTAAALDFINGKYVTVKEAAELAAQYPG